MPLREQFVLGTEITARPLAESDAADLLAVLGDDPEMTWTRRSWNADNVGYLLRLRLEHYAYGFGVYALEDGDGTFLGMAGLQFWDDDSEDVEVIAYVRKDRWARGIARTALEWCLKVTFEECPAVTRIVAATRHDNVAAQTLAKRLGMTVTGEGEHYGAPSIYWVLDRT
jgi:RimJ/RimL family protein N-acetyltransferase